MMGPGEVILVLKKGLGLRGFRQPLYWGQGSRVLLRALTIANEVVQREGCKSPSCKLGTHSLTRSQSFQTL